MGDNLRQLPATTTTTPETIPYFNPWNDAILLIVVLTIIIVLVVILVTFIIIHLERTKPGDTIMSTTFGRRQRKT